MPVIPSGKYQLRSLHEEIDLFDRKLAHLQKYEAFATEEERSTSVEKMTAKRNLLIRKAQQMIDEGIEFSESERPRSLRPHEDDVEVLEDPSVDTPKPPTAVSEIPAAPIPSPYSGTALDYTQDLQNYRKNRTKHKTA
ncbi:hypothetical protein JAO29_11135 [Edaphobacter sp. HDX4]|uniref:hypothetical protein n=1 Tax=Edaphobacter sp. HDX4 TaxID=2794064 RepID=UPI002FE65E64